MCNNIIEIDSPEYVTKLKKIEETIDKCEMTALKIKAVNFINMQSFDSVYAHYELGEVYKVDGIGYTVITKKTIKVIEFVIIMNLNSVWYKHWQDVDKKIQIKQGTYFDLFTKQEYKDEVNIKAFEPSFFKAVGEDDLIMKGKIFKP